LSRYRSRNFDNNKDDGFRNKRKRSEKTEVFKENFINTYKLAKIRPITETQEKVFDSYHNDKNLVCYGSAGSGKTFLSIYLAMLSISIRKYQKLIIIRSAVPSRDVGFLPGKISEKMAVYELPYQGIFNELYHSPKAYESFKTNGLVEFESTSFLRGITLNNSIVIFDEAQNATDNELNTVLTRIGENSRIILCGDFYQNDLKDTKQKSGLFSIINILGRMNEVDLIQFGIEDIVRSGFVKNYIIAKENYNKEEKENA
jgi:phosphate starvation-inducible protein PhoH